MTFRSRGLWPFALGLALLTGHGPTALAAEEVVLATAPAAATTTTTIEAAPAAPALPKPSAVAAIPAGSASDATEPADTPAVEPKPPGPVVVARVDLTAQRMTVTVAGKAEHSWRISSGAIGYRTPTGTFRPQILSKHHRSSLYYGAPMPYAVFFNGHIATHGTTAVRHLGRPASHGCVRLDTENARTFFELVRTHGKANVQIIVEGSTPTDGVSIASGRRPRPSSTAAAPAPGRYADWARRALGVN